MTDQLNDVCKALRDGGSQIVAASTDGGLAEALKRVAKIDLQGLAGSDDLGKKLCQGLGAHLDELNKLLPTMISCVSDRGQVQLGVADLIDATDQKSTISNGEMY